MRAGLTLAFLRRNKADTNPIHASGIVAPWQPPGAAPVPGDGNSAYSEVLHPRMMPNGKQV
ncbi:MAG: hypothetical protein JWQ13_4337 [Ramlibacter sp.]|jgi:hypothetical protein|nr:hypothetical protein [Ramlibacter sp.]